MDYQHTASPEDGSSGQDDRKVGNLANAITSSVDDPPVMSGDSEESREKGLESSESNANAVDITHDSPKKDGERNQRLVWNWIPRTIPPSKARRHKNIKTEETGLNPLL